METEFLYGINTAEEVLSAKRRRIVRLILSNREKGPRINNIVSMAREMGIRPEFADPRKMDKIAAGGNHQGVIMEAEPPKKMTLEQALERISDSKRTVWAALDGITDPMNLGAIIRSAACLGVSAILLPERRSASINPAAQKAASGAIERIDVVEAGNLNAAIARLKEKGFWVYGLDVKGQSLPATQFAYPALIIIGSEGDGIHQKVKEKCDFILTIPQKGGVQSLNAGNAAAIAFYEAGIKRKAA